jgi:hypothetical protein
VSGGRQLSAFIRVNRWLSLVRLALAIFLAITATTHAEDETEDTSQTTTDTYRSPWADDSDSTDPLTSSSTRHSSPVTSHLLSSPDPLLPKRNPGDFIDTRPTRKVYDIDNRGRREIYPETVIKPGIHDRYEVYGTDRDGITELEPKAIIKPGLRDSYEVYKTDRDGLAVDEPHLVIKEGVRDGEYKVYDTDRYGMPEDIPSKVIKTDILGRQKVYRTDRYGMPIGDPINERIVE